MILENKAAIITGGGTGIGREIALTFAREGATTVVVSRNMAPLNKVVAEISSSGGAATAVQADVADVIQVESMVSEVMRRYGRIDILVNNAGIPGPVIPVADMDRTLWDEVIAVNLTGTMLCSKYVLNRSMISNRHGAIINISSELGRRGLGLRSSYCVSKWGIIGFTQSLAWEAGEHGIRVNCIAPGPVEGERLMRSMVERSKALNIPTNDLLKDFYERSPLNRLVTNDEIAKIALFLVSDNSSGITGQTINCAAGIMMN
jgi:NAD(P)-dependent dehydrogenase (short-subunit alcohol dehydrogenase family)